MKRIGIEFLNLSLSNNALFLSSIFFPLIFLLLLDISYRCIGDRNATEVEAEGDLMNRTTPLEPAASETMVPALGKHWKTICSHRLQIQKTFDRSNGRTNAFTTQNRRANERTIRILKSNQNPINIQCIVHVTDAGII